MARMLGHYGGGECGCTDCSPPRGRHSAKLTSRHRKRTEQRELEREMSRRDPLPAPYTDYSDCRHGCNGDCLISGSGRCDFTCHGEQDAAHPCEGCGLPTMNWHEGWFCTDQCVGDYLDGLVAGWDWQWVVDDVLSWNQQRG